MKPSSPPQKSGVITPLEERCQGCGICELVCSLTHEGACGPQFSRIHLRRNPFTEACVQSLCIQCDWPSCYFACPVGAIVIDEKTGARVIVENECTGCRACAQVCPLNGEGTILKYNPKENKYFKCDLCGSRPSGPACVEACP